VTAVADRPDGEPRIDIVRVPSSTVVLAANLSTPAGILELHRLFAFLAAACALHQQGARRIVGFVSEIPFARQDRRTHSTAELAAADWTAQLLDGSDLAALVTWQTTPDFRDRLRRTQLVTPSGTDDARGGGGPRSVPGGLLADGRPTRLSGRPAIGCPADLELPATTELDIAKPLLDALRLAVRGDLTPAHPAARRRSRRAVEL
jgi:hypothetical protein